MSPTMRAWRTHEYGPRPTEVLQLDEVEIPLADPIQMVWDLQDLGGAEREEAAGVMREWILNQP